MIALPRSAPFRLAALALAAGLALAALAPGAGGVHRKEALGVLPVRRERPFLRGMCVTLHDEDRERDYSPEIDEVASRLSASHVSVVFHLYQGGKTSRGLEPHPRTPSDATIRRTLEAARARGLGALLMPIVVLVNPASGDWRGTLAPPDSPLWFSIYGKELVRYAKLAEEAHAEYFCVGSELAWADGETALWQKLIADVRSVFSGKIAYSANWDDYEPVSFWREIDLVGVTGYHELARERGASDRALREAWERAREELVAWHRATWPRKPLVFTEVGYASQEGASVHPWDYTGRNPVDLAEQRRCYEAFLAAWAPSPDLAGVFFYEWWGEGGTRDSSYTPRGKPAEETIRRFFDDMKFVERQSH